ncbi:MAG: hypothetical protein PHS84_14505 [Paludibacter sp.]|nr:hypothetical protein [Paludibacter sp.]
MKTEDYINDFITREKQTEINPYLSSKIMASIASPVERKKTTLWVNLAVAASIAVVLMIGFQLGGMYVTNQEQYAGMTINDSEIESFTLYNSDDNE